MDHVAVAFGKIVGEIRGVSQNIGGAATELSAVSHELLAQSEEMTAQAGHVASGTEQMATNITTMAAAGEEMSMNVASISSASEEISVNVGTISSAAETTARNVTAVATATQESTQTFEAIASDAREGSQIAGRAMTMADGASTTMKELDRSAAEIGKVTETIKMIALQTNLLALNATIEATSAGEAGKGFAVVANEIKELANQSAQAAEDIARKIDGVQSSTREAVGVIREVQQIIHALNTSSVRISEAVDKQSALGQGQCRQPGRGQPGRGAHRPLHRRGRQGRQRHVPERRARPPRRPTTCPATRAKRPRRSATSPATSTASARRPATTPPAPSKSTRPPSAWRRSPANSSNSSGSSRSRIDERGPVCDLGAGRVLPTVLSREVCTTRFTGQSRIQTSKVRLRTARSWQRPARGRFNGFRRQFGPARTKG